MVPEFPSKDERKSAGFDFKGKLVGRSTRFPRPGETGHETWEVTPERRTGAKRWSTMSVDNERGLIFLPLGSSSYDFMAGGPQEGRQSLSANSLVP